MMPSNVHKVLPEMAHKIDFSTPAVRRHQFDQRVSGVGEGSSLRTLASCADTCDHGPTTMADLDPLLKVLQKHTPQASCLSGMMDYYHLHIDPVQPQILPKSLRCLRDPSKDGWELSLLQQHCNGLQHLAQVTDSQASLVEQRTRGQHQSPTWYRLRAGRITASVIHAVSTTSIENPAITTVRRVCYPNKTASTQATQWGITHEDEARQAYIRNTAPQHSNFRVEQCGLLINPAFPEVGASPDGVIYCTCCGKGCLEIKCSFKHRFKSALEAHAQDKDFYLEVTDGTPTLKKQHSYYSQIQTQMCVSGSTFCDFVVWTTIDCLVIRVFRDDRFWEQLRTKAQEFFVNVCLPELVACHFTKEGSEKP